MLEFVIFIGGVAMLIALFTGNGFLFVIAMLAILVVAAAGLLRHG